MVPERLDKFTHPSCIFRKNIPILNHFFCNGYLLKRETAMPDRYGNYSYYDTPDGEDGPKKAWYISKWTAKLSNKLLLLFMINDYYYYYYYY